MARVLADEELAGVEVQLCGTTAVEAVSPGGGPHGQNREHHPELYPEENKEESFHVGISY